MAPDMSKSLLFVSTSLTDIESADIENIVDYSVAVIVNEYFGVTRSG
jgi:hypothetical protein